MITLAMALASLSAVQADEPAQTFEEWRSSGARPLIIHMMADDDLSADDREILSMLSEREDQRSSLTLNDGTRFTVTPDYYDVEFADALVEGLSAEALIEWEQSEQNNYAYFAMISDQAWTLALQVKINALYPDWEEYNRAPHLYRFGNQDIIMRNFFPGVYKNAIELLEYQAWYAMTEFGDANVSDEAIASARPACLETPSGC